MSRSTSQIYTFPSGTSDSVAIVMATWVAVALHLAIIISPKLSNRSYPDFDGVNNFGSCRDISYTFIKPFNVNIVKYCPLNDAPIGLPENDK